MTVINTIELTKTAPGMNIALAIGIALFAILMTIGFLLVSSLNHKREMIGMWCVSIALVLCLFLIIMGLIKDNVTIPTGKYQYEITIDDAVSFNEVIEQYDIIERRGEIFVVEERENE